MSLRFYFGPSGAGKSRQLYEEIIRRSGQHPRQNFLIIVPDQFTMQTQKDLVTLHERGGILNIDVLSFGRLSHRILEEVGVREVPVLDDTGKSLVLQKVAAGLKNELPVLGGLLHRQGYIHEVKSAISEFMQYGIGVEDLTELIGFSGKRGALVHKLKDLQTLYRGFQEYISGHFVTAEETLDVLRRSLVKSKLLPGSVIVFDGFTGFTPIQNRLIQELMSICEETIVTVTMGAGENPYQLDGEQRLFHLSKKTVADLEKLAKEANISRERDVFILPADALTGEDGDTARKVDSLFPENLRKSLDIRCNPQHRFRETPALRHLERELFRYTYKPFSLQGEGETGTGEEAAESIQLYETLTPGDEVHQTGLLIRSLIREQGFSYRDIAVVMGDLEGYAPYVETEFKQMDIPCFIDRTSGILLNPMVEYIKSALGLFTRDFTYQAVFHYLRSGLSDISREDVDSLENYVLQTGIRGYRKWSRMFTRKTFQMGEKEEELTHLNAVRESLLRQVEMLHPGSGRKGGGSAGDYVNRLYDFLVANRVQEKLVEYENRFTQQGNLTKAREYAQIYRLVMELLNQVHELVGEESVTMQEFADILEAGFGEIEVGTIPQNVDRVVVGDMERTRLKQVKALFFLGVNDGNIPRNASKGGIISDMDREFLQESGLELAPTPRQQMYIQRLYLYLNMTKPSKRLYLSYSKMNSQGRSLRPAYLLEVMCRLFPGLTVIHPQSRSPLEQMVTAAEGMKYLAEGLRTYAEGSIRPEQEEAFFTIYHVYGREALAEKRMLLTGAAFKRYQDSGLSRAVARALYGRELENSVTRLETYAACACRHFLQYGLTLREREEFGFETVDMGNVYHGVLELFARKLEQSDYTWFDFPEEFGAQAVEEALEEFASEYGNTVLYANARNEYAIRRMGRVLQRTVSALQHQLKKGSFSPDAYELSFQHAENLESVNVALSDKEKMRLRGRIDRIDVAKDGDRVYVKVIDYKSGNRQFDLAALYYGLQLQLVVYMNAALELEEKKHPDKEVVPAALLYYHVEDPAVESPVELTAEEINDQILAKLRMNGVVNSEPDIIERLDRYLQNKSDVIPVEKKKDGSFSARSSVMSREELQVVSRYVNEKVKEIGREILEGKTGVNPYEKGASEACTYCAYRKVCGFDPAVPGYERRTLEELDKEEILERMRQ